MLTELLVTGSELVQGRLVDTNSPWLLERLRSWGANVTRVTLVGDDAPAIERALSEAAVRADLVVVSGGLGPTSDDLTAECAARVAGTELVEDEGTLDLLRARLARRGRTMTAAQARQARVPRGAEVLANAVGSAPGFRIGIHRAQCFFFAGVPLEFKHLVDTHLSPFVCRRQQVHTATRTLRCFGLPESELDTKVHPAAVAHGVELGLRAAWPETWAIFSAMDEDAAAATVRVEAAVREARSALDDRCFSAEGESLAQVVALRALAAGARIATAESCTGGLVGGALTELSGSSGWYVGGFVTYSNELKTRLLGVDPLLLAAHGAVSEPVARAMAMGAREATGATHAIAVTGIAGPGGGSPEKPVGTVWLAVATPTGTRTHLLQSTRDDRRSVREVAVATALDLLRRALQEG